MATFRYVNIKLPESKKLADLVGLSIDIQQCKEYCESYIQDPFNRKFSTSLMIAAFIKYSRCFVGGVRIHSERDLHDKIPQNLVDTHNFIIDLRNKYIAHSVNDFEYHRVRVWLNPEERGKQINGVNIESHYLGAPEVRKFEELILLCDHHLFILKELINTEELRLLQLVKTKFTVDELYNLEAELPPDIDYGKITEKRRQC